MRCEYCGRNNATFHYKSVMNGRSEEVHLCPDCAAELGYSGGFEEGFNGLLGQPFGSVFSLLPKLGGFDLTYGPRLTPAARRTLRPVTVLDEQPLSEAESLLDADEEQALRRERERNALQVRLAEAVESERYEEAARLRDELKKLEE